MGAGQFGCEVLNFLLKRMIKEKRPPRMSFLYNPTIRGRSLRIKGMKTLIQRTNRNERQRLRHALLPRAIHILLRNLPNPLPAPAAPPHRLLIPHTLHKPPTSPPLPRRAPFRPHRLLEPDLPFLS